MAEQAALAAGHGEPGGVGRNRQVARRNQLASGRGGEGVHLGDHRLRNRLNGVHHRRAHREQFAGLVQAGSRHVTEVVTGAEHRTTRRKDHARRLALAHLTEGLGHLEHQLERQGVALLGSIEGDCRERPITAHEEVFVHHVHSLADPPVGIHRLGDNAVMTSGFEAGHDSLPPLLRNASFERVPIGSFDRNLAELPPGSNVTVTSSPKHGTAATLDACQKAIDRGHRVVPHIAGRMIEDGRDLCRLVSRVQRMGVDELFVIAGDSYRPVGGYADTLTFIKVIPGVSADRAVEGRCRHDQTLLAQANTTIDQLTDFRAQALARLAAQHEEILRLRAAPNPTAKVTRLPAPPQKVIGPC